MNSTFPPFQLTAALPVPVLLLALLAAGAFSAWTYRRTNPPVGVPVRIILGSLRFLGIVGGIFLLFQPVVKLVQTETELPNLTILLDRSASMSLGFENVNKNQQINALITSPELQRLSELVSVKAYSFSDSLRPLPGFPTSSGDSDGPITAIGDVLKEALSVPATPDMVLMLSDGVNNSGIDPARVAGLSKVPISTIGIGSPMQAFDLMISDVAVSTVVYQGSRVPVEVDYRAIGASDTRFDLIIRDINGEVVERQSILARDGFTEGKAFFEVPIDSSGRFVYRIEIPELNGELTRDNNYRSIVINSLANRLRILLLSGPPDYGLGDLVRRLSANPHTELTLRSEKQGGFYEGDWPDERMLANADVVILHHFPTSHTSTAKLDLFYSVLLEKNLPVCLIDGNDLDAARLQSLSEALPVTILPGTAIRQGRLVPMRRHAILAAPEDPNFGERWQELPPLLGRINGVKEKNNSETLAEFVYADGSRTPAIVVQETAGRKSAVLLMRDFWRWGLLSPGSEGIVEPLFDRLVKWLAIRRSNKPVQLTFSKEQFSTGETVSFRVSCFDENLQPFNGAEVTALITSESGQPIKMTLTGEGNGWYRGGFLPWGVGTYRVDVTALSGEAALGNDNGIVLVEAYSIELLDAHLNRNLLQAIADGSGGKYVPFDSAALYFGSLTFVPKLVNTYNIIELWGGWLHLILVIGVLSMEWLIRMRLSML